MADLQGRTVAVNRGGTGEYLLVRALDTANVPVNRVVRAYLAPPDSASALTGGHVDAWATWDPFLSVVLQNGSARLLVDGAQAGSENAVAFFVGQEFLRAHRAVVAVVFDVLRSENAWARAHRQEAGEIWVRELGLPMAVASRLGEYDTNPIGPVGPDETRHIEHIADWYVENGIIPSRPDIASFVTDISRSD
jgi:sulfonate transport system substrate-binding protein